MGQGGASTGGGGLPYGSVQNPVDPGSASGSSTSYQSGHGGGAVRINATGRVVVNGSIKANGQIGTTYYGAGGSGGSIWITCDVFYGTNGTVEASGGSVGYAYAGAGGGGRISVEYNAGSQGSANKPSVTFLADPGAASYGQTYANPSYGADLGTLYFPDDGILDPNWVPHRGQWTVPGTNHVFSTLVLSNAWLRFPGENENVTISNNLLLTGAKLDLGGDAMVTTTLATANYYYPLARTNGPALRCGGDVTLTNSSVLHLFAGQTNGTAGAYGGLLGITGKLEIASGSWVYPWSHPTNGGSIKMELGTVMVQPGGGVNADYVGFIGALPRDSGRGYVGFGPGRAAGSVAAAGYGGRGADYSTINGGMPYGSVSDPTDPGSGGSGEANVYVGGNGGGLIWITATGAVTMHGTLTALGAYGGDGGGSGGGINLRCATFAGTSGVIRADGGSTANSGGGGGRIAIVPSDSAGQASLAKPRVRFSAAKGAASTYTAYDVGTIYLGDLGLFDSAWLPHAGQIQFSSSTVAFDSLTLTNGAIRFSQEGLQFTVTNDLLVSGPSALLGFGGNKTFRFQYDTSNEMLSSESAGPVLAVGGNLVVTNGGSLTIYGGLTNAAGPDYGALVTVGQTLFVATNSWIRPVSHLTNGGSVCFQARDVVVLTNGGFNADYRGFKKAGTERVAGYGPGAARGVDSGAGYGGIGGLYTAPRGGTYGSSNAPIDAGSGGAGEANVSFRGGNGGGLIRIHATNDITINGTLSAVGQTGNSGYGGGAGGGIYLTSRGFFGAVGGVIKADGASGTYIGGGGGRIAVVRMPSHVGYQGTYSAAAGSGGAGANAPSNGTIVILNDTNYPLINNEDTQNITANGAEMIGNLTTNGSSAASVYVYWGTNDGGTVKGAWNTNTALGVRSPGYVTNDLSGLLAGGTKYYYRFYATNASGDEWAPATTNFSTMGSVSVDNGGGATAVTQTSATLRGTMLGGFPTPSVYICWSTANTPSTSTGDWQHVEAMGEQSGAFSTNLTGLLANQTYYYRCYAINIYGEDWADEVTNFTTLSPSVTISDAVVTEGAPLTTVNADFTLTLSATSAVAVSVDAASAGGSAASDGDFVATNGTVVFPAGTVTRTFVVVVNGDSADEFPSEDFSVGLSSPSGVTVADSLGLGTITDDDDVADTKRWNGTANWNADSFWTPYGRPSPSDVAIIQSGTVTLTNPASLVSLVVSNGTSLVMSNWMTKVTAAGDVTVLTNASITLPPAFTNSAMSNRVWIACSNLTLVAGGTINVDGKGYAGGPRQPVSRGNGPSNAGLYSGGGHGGHGGSYGGNSISPPYGNAEAPETPGSGGGGDNDSYGTAGGGAVRIEASGHVLVNGTITGNGDGSGGYCNGSGGGIWLTCRTFGGTGIVRANGAVGNGNYSFGGGGRIAVVVDSAAQAALAKPRVVLSAARGTGTYYWKAPNMGTLYLSDVVLLDEVWLPHTGRLHFPGGSWAVNSLVVSNGWVRLEKEGFQLSVSNDLQVIGTGAGLDLGGNVAVTSQYTFVREMIYSETNGPTLAVGGNLTLDQGTFLTIYGGMTNVSREYGAVVSVGGTVTVNSNAWIYPHSNPTNGGSPFFSVGNLVVATGNSGINADGRGFRRMMPFTGETIGRGPGGAGADSGGSYGGTGAVYFLPAGQTYGSSNAPTDPGSGGGCEQSFTYGAGNGGGLIRVDAARLIRVNGTLSANGAVSLSGSSYGCGSGGGIYLSCQTFDGAAGAVIRADGASGYAGGGGGRIAIKRIPGLQTYQGGVTASAGTTVYGTAGTGTIVWLVMPYPGTVFHVR